MHTSVSAVVSGRAFVTSRHWSDKALCSSQGQPVGLAPTRSFSAVAECAVLQSIGTDPVTSTD